MAEGEVLLRREASGGEPQGARLPLPRDDEETTRLGDLVLLKREMAK